MAIARVIGNQIEEHADSASARLADEPLDVIRFTELGMHAVVVCDVVAPVLVGRRVNRRQPDRIHAEPGEMIELGDDTEKVADAVPVRVGERSDVDLIEDGVTPPG